MERLYQYLTPGGEICIGNYHVSNPSKYYMAYFGDWFLIHRTEKEFLGLFQKNAKNKISLRWDETGSQMFLHVQKQKDEWWWNIPDFLAAIGYNLLWIRAGSICLTDLSPFSYKHFLKSNIPNSLLAGLLSHPYRNQLSLNPLQYFFVFCVIGLACPNSDILHK